MKNKLLILNFLSAKGMINIDYPINRELKSVK